MTPTERERIEDDADAHASSETYEYQAKESYIAGAVAEHDKARNQAIDACMERIQKYFDKGDMDTPKLLTDMLESLKTIS